MRNSERFISSYNKIDDFLRDYLKKEKYVPFNQLVNEASKSHSTVRMYREDLKEYKDLRNAIVHDSIDGQTIAEPHDEVVRTIEKIEKLLTDPPRVIPLFKKRVFSLPEDTPVAKALKMMYESSFTQIPILDREDVFIDLLTVYTISRWLGASIKDDELNLTDIRISQVLNHRQDHFRYRFISRSTSIVEVLELFQQATREGKRLEAVLITENGNLTEKLLGIITPWDLPVIYNKLQD